MLMKNYKVINEIKVFYFNSIGQLIDTASNENKILVAINSDKITYADNRLKNIINNNIGYTDGIGAVWALNQKGIKNIIKISGSDLWLDFIKKFHTTKSFYLVGSKPVVIEKVVKKLRSDFKSINICGYRDGFIKTIDEKNILIQDIKETKPDFIFIAMGSPKQEYLMEDIYRDYPKTMLGLGGSFDIYSGINKRAPKFILYLNLEFLYRYIFNNVKFKRILTDFKFFLMLIFRKL